MRLENQVRIELPVDANVALGDVETFLVYPGGWES